MKQIEKGEDVYLENCRIVGELDVSKIKLKTIPNPYFNQLLEKGESKEWLISEGFNENASVIESNIIIKNSIFENNIDLSEILFYNSADFSHVNFNGSVDFSGTNFYDSSDFSGTNFNGLADFSYVNFNNSCDFSETKFNDFSYFSCTNFNNSAWFSNINFNGSANFYGETSFNGPVNFSGTSFYDFSDFSWANFNDSYNFSGTKFYGPSDFFEVRVLNYTKVKAEEILKQIENGEEVNLVNCIIVGELNVSTIRRQTIPNPCFNELLNKGIDKEVIIFNGCHENSIVIESDVTIKNSIFENDVNFSNALFNNSTAFSYVNFNGSSNFAGTSFNDSSDFSGTNFNGSANFFGANFNDPYGFYDIDFNSSAFFIEANFNQFANFCGTNFNYFADFSDANFNGDVWFYYTNFDDANFCGASFNYSVDFSEANLNGDADFTIADFNDSADFIGPEASENIITDGKTCGFFRKYYQSETRYEDADNIYYNYRRHYQADKGWSDLSKWADILSWITCGYGMRPFNTFLFGTMVIILFAFIYANPISFNNSSNKIIPFKLSLENPGIVKGNDNSQKASPLDLFYYSIGIFTFINQGSWYPRDNFRKWVTLEGVLGWATLGIFMATLTAELIRV